MSTLATLAGELPQTPKPAPIVPSGGVQVIPYDANFDPNAQQFLPYFWQRLKDDGLVDLYFPGASATGFASFVKLFSSSPGVQVLLVVTKDTKGDVDKVIGFATWEPVTIGSATMGHAGFIFLREFWGTPSTREAAEEIMRHWFKETKLDVAVGIVASANHLANNFLRHLGWERVGTIPKMHQYGGKQSDAVIWHMTREHFEERG